jgi:hypothetical protein
MIEIIKPRRYCEETTYERHFSYVSDHPGMRGAGFSFPCTKDGEVNIEILHHSACLNLACCLDGKQWCMVGMQYHDWEGMHPILCTGQWELVEIRDEGMRENTRRWVEASVGRCECGEEVSLGNFTNTCDCCGRDYNMSGQLLADRSQWGEETGESLDEILSIP